MKKIFIGVRDVDEATFRKRALARKIKLGNMLTAAIEKYVKDEKLKEKETKRDPRNLLKIKGIITTKEKVRWSGEIDEILYGGDDIS